MSSCLTSREDVERWRELFERHSIFYIQLLYSTFINLQTLFFYSSSETIVVAFMLCISNLIKPIFKYNSITSTVRYKVIHSEADYKSPNKGKNIIYSMLCSQNTIVFTKYEYSLKLKLNYKNINGHKMTARIVNSIPQWRRVWECSPW